VNTLIPHLRGNDKAHRVSRAFLTILLGSFALVGFGQASAIAQVKVRVETISGDPVSGRFTKLTDSQLELKTEAGETNVVNLQDVLTISATDFDNVKVTPVSRTGSFSRPAIDCA